jgi:putative solute:sodium symporter small subunit
MSDKENDYWRANIRLMLSLLFVWFVVSFVCGILLLDFLNQFHLFGFKLGYWFSQQGSIFVFVCLIFIYTWRMNKLDKMFGVEEEMMVDNATMEGTSIEDSSVNSSKYLKRDVSDGEG